MLHNFHTLVCLESWSTKGKLEYWKTQKLCKLGQASNNCWDLFRCFYLKYMKDLFFCKNPPPVAKNPHRYHPHLLCWHNADRCLLVEGWKVFGYWGGDRSPGTKNGQGLEIPGDNVKRFCWDTKRKNIICGWKKVTRLEQLRRYLLEISTTENITFISGV